MAHFEAELLDERRSRIPFRLWWLPRLRWLFRLWWLFRPWQLFRPWLLSKLWWLFRLWWCRWECGGGAERQRLSRRKQQHWQKHGKHWQTRERAPLILLRSLILVIDLGVYALFF